MIFFFLLMVGQVFCFCHQWWVTSRDFFPSHPQRGVIPSDVFVITNGGSLQVMFFFATNH
jgi:hypothetical protein